jgi:hypothetical protein
MQHDTIQTRKDRSIGLVEAPRFRSLALRLQSAKEVRAGIHALGIDTLF